MKLSLTLRLLSRMKTCGVVAWVDCRRTSLPSIKRAETFAENFAHFVEFCHTSEKPWIMWLEKRNEMRYMNKQKPSLFGGPKL